MLIRALLFALPVIAALLAITLPRGPVLAALIALLVIAAPVHIVAHDGNAAYDYVSEDEIEGFRFVAERRSPGCTVATRPGRFCAAPTCSSATA